MLASTISAPAPTAQSSRPTALLGVILAVWFGVALALGSAGVFVAPAGQPPLAFLAAVLLPIVVFAVAYTSSAAVRDYVRSGDPVLLTNLQSWRIVGGTFLVLLTFGLLPSRFAIPAGWGDVAIGVTAPFVASALVARGPARTGRLFVIWQLLGILDLVVAVGAGASLRLAADATGDAEKMVLMNQLPLSLVPTFAVPLFVILHLASLAQYRALAISAERE